MYVVPSVGVHEQKAHGYGLQWAVDRRDQCLLRSWALPTIWSKIKHVYNDFDGSVVLMSHSDAQISMAIFCADRQMDRIDCFTPWACAQGNYAVREISSNFTSFVGKGWRMCMQWLAATSSPGSLIF